MLVSFASMFFMMLGVLSFAGMQNAGADPEALMGPAAFLGMTGMFTIMVAQFVLAILLLWWLTRPSQAGDNEYGPPAAS